jgi:uncharacterized surface anchored protein
MLKSAFQAEYGVYVIKEESVPVGYIISPDTLAATIDTQDEVVIATPSTLENTQIIGDITFVKHDDNGTGLNGAVFGLYLASDTTTPLATTTSGSDGSVTFVDVKYGDYVIKEETPPTGFILSTEQITASIITHNSTVTATPATVSNIRIKGNVSFIKTDDHGGRLADAVFGIYSANDTTTLLKSETSDADGQLTFTDMLYGDYVIKEDTVPDGYVGYTSDITATIGSNDHGNTVSASPATIVNILIVGSISVRALDDQGQNLPGAVFALFAVGAPNTQLATATSGTTGVATFSNIVPGSYVIRQISAPSGYFVSSEPISAIIPEDGGSTNASPSSVTNNLIMGSIRFRTTVGGGSVFAIFSASDPDVRLDTATTDENGNVVFPDMLPGDYLIKQLTAPSGYSPSTAVMEVTVNDDGTINVTKQATFVTTQLSDGEGGREVNPKTGLKWYFVLLIVIAFLAILLGVAIIIKKRMALQEEA